MSSDVVCSGCSLDFVEPWDNDVIHISEISSHGQGYKISHGFQALPFQLARHERLLGGARGSTDVSSRVIVLQSYDLHSGCVLWFLKNNQPSKTNAWQYHMWLDKSARRDDAAFSSLWWEIQNPSNQQYSRTNSQRFSSESETSINALTIPMTALVSRHSVGYNRKVRDYHLFPASEAAPYRRGAGVENKGNRFLLDDFVFQDSCEDIIVRTQEPNFADHIPTGILPMGEYVT